jgi:hypothetical protein
MKSEKIIFELNIKNSVLSLSIGFAIITGVIFGKMTERKHCFYDEREVNCKKWNSGFEIAHSETNFNFGNALIASISTTGIFLIGSGIYQLIQENKKNQN